MQVAPGEINSVPVSLNTVSTSLFATADTSVVDAVTLIKFVLDTLVPCIG